MRQSMPSKSIASCAGLTLTLPSAGEAAPLKALGEQAGPLAIPPDHLDQVTPSAAKDEEMTAEGILRQNPLGQNR